MDNKKIISIILGSLALSIQNNDLFKNTACFIFDAGTIIGFTLITILNLVSFIGIILTIIFSVILIKNNLSSNKK